MTAKNNITALDRLRRAQETVAKLVVADPAFSPIFKRLEEEIALEEALADGDVVARARAMMAQRATF